MAQENPGRPDALANGGSESFLQAVIDGIPESVVVIDRSHRIVLANRVVRELCGGRDPAAYKLTCHEVLHGSETPCEGPDHLCTLKEVLASGSPFTVTHRHVGSDGTDRFIELVAAPISSKAGKVTHVVESGRDVSERLRAEEERSRLTARLHEAQKLESLAVLAGGIAHDFNNLLAAILGNAELAMRELPIDSFANECLQEVESAAERAAYLAEQMLAYSGKGRFAVTSLDLNDLVEEITLLMKLTLGKEVRFACHLADDIPPIEADEKQIPHLLMNLITNAAEANRDAGGIISIRTTMRQCDRPYLSKTLLGEELPEGRYVCLEIEDSGCGMDEATLEKIFEPFFTTKFPGRGLGLSAVLGIVRGHRGTLEVSSRPGVGSTFTILLPPRGDGAAATA
jgi:PAS domain S-box-containing protein